MKRVTIDIRLVDLCDFEEDSIIKVHTFVEGALEIAGIDPADVEFAETVFSHSHGEGEHYAVGLDVPDHLAARIEHHFSVDARAAALDADEQVGTGDAVLTAYGPGLVQATSRTDRGPVYWVKLSGGHLKNGRDDPWLERNELREVLWRPQRV